MTKRKSDGPIYRVKLRLPNGKHVFEYVVGADEAHAMSEACHMLVGHKGLTDDEICNAVPVYARLCK